jgi:hypothetical protein
LTIFASLPAVDLAIPAPHAIFQVYYSGVMLFPNMRTGGYVTNVAELSIDEYAFFKRFSHKV